MNKALANLNGEILPLHEAKVPVLDRGFLFGDGVYEVARIYGGRPFQLQAHWERLERSLKGLRIEPVRLDRLRDRALELIERAALPEALLYVQITRGVASNRSHVFPESSVSPTELLAVTPFVDSGASLRTEGCLVITRPEIRWARCDLKTVNLLGNVLAAQEAKEAGAYEALWVNDVGEITEGARTNVFAIIDGKLRTKPNGASILPGVTRDFILKLARAEGIAIEERAFTVADLDAVSEMFLSGTTSEVMPVVQVDERAIAGGRPGPLTRRLMEKYREHVRNH